MKFKSKNKIKEYNLNLLKFIYICIFGDNFVKRLGNNFYENKIVLVF